MSKAEIEREIADSLPDRPFLTAAEYAEAIGVPEQSLANQRLRRVGPPFVRLQRSVRYPRGPLIKYLAERAVTTSTD